MNNDERDALIKQLWEIQNHKSFISGREIDLQLHKGNLDIDHIVPLTNGGKDDPQNFALTFSSENRSKQASDLNLARMMWKFKNLADELQRKENRNPNLSDILQQYKGGQHKLHCVRVNDVVKVSFPEIGDTNIYSLPIYKDEQSNMEYFFALLPIEYIYHDDFINPRAISGASLIKLLAEFYNKNPQLQIGLGYIYTNDDNACEMKMFDGQHKAAAQILLGTKKIPIRIFVNPNKDTLLKSNTNAGTTLRQVAFDKSVQRHLGSALYQDRVEKYQKLTNRQADDYSFSEKTLINFYKGESREMKRYILDAVKDNITYNEDNRLRQFIDMGGRAKEKPLSYSSVEKTFYSFFLSQDSLATPLDYKMDIGENPRELEEAQMVRLMNIIADKILIGKFDLEIGTFKIENRIQQGEELPWNHVVAYRMLKEEVLYAWLRYIIDVIMNFLITTGKSVADKHNFFQEPLEGQLWVNIENFVSNLMNLPLWKDKEMSSSIFGGKQNYNFWRTIFETGSTPSGAQILTHPININEMIKPLVVE